MNKVILFQGDSITDCGRVRENPAHESQALGQGYPALIAAKVMSSDWGTRRTFVNKGISGDRVVDLYARWKRDAINIRPDVLSILIGVNDTWHEMSYSNGVEPARYDKFYRMLLDWSLESKADTKFVLLEPFILKFGFITSAWVDEISERQQIVKKIAADYNAVFVPLQKKIEEAADAARNPALVLRDGVHPTLYGHQLIADECLKYAGELYK
ncbi:MAG: SGNH/GDSL hydrolase family protein [Lentisphaeria bacterium]|nr:SGNH/GDSL hydrolase family protein [Lentisphaeria bacterium]